MKETKKKKKAKYKKYFLLLENFNHWEFEIAWQYSFVSHYCTVSKGRSTEQGREECRVDLKGEMENTQHSA